MKIGEAMYKNMPNEGETGESAPGGDAGGEQKVDYEDVKDKDKK